MSSFKRRVPDVGVGVSAGAAARTAPTAGPSSAAGVPTPSPAAGPSASSSLHKLPDGVRPSPTSSLPQPLLSSGIAALDDLVAGRGMPSGTTLLLLPEDYTQPLTTSRASSASQPLDAWALAAAEPYTDLVLAYGIAQGIAHRHVNIVIGEQAGAFCQSLMARIGDEPEPASSSSSPASTSATAANSKQGASDSTDLKIAFRYANLPILNNDDQDQPKAAAQGAQSTFSSSSASSEFPSPFDLSRRISPRVLEKARADGLLHCIEVGPSLDASAASTLDHIFEQVQERVKLLKTAAESSPDAQAPVLRIHIRALGSLAWQPSATPAALFAFLLRIKSLLRSLSVAPAPGMAADSAGANQAHKIPAIATCTLSSHAITASPAVDLVHRLASLADTALALSSFDARPSLRHLLVPPPSSTSSSSSSSSSSQRSSKGSRSSHKTAHGYTGAVRVLRSAAGIGGWPNEVVRASVLRGMSSSSSASSASSSASASSGAGGAGENDLAFRVGRKKLTIELLNVDDIGLARRDEAEEQQKGGGAAGGKGSEGDDVLRRMEELRVKEEELRTAARAAALPLPSSRSNPQVITQQSAPSGALSSPPTSAATHGASPGTGSSHLAAGAAGTSSFKRGGGGLASLRARGLAARAAAAGSTGGPAPAPAPITVELEPSGGDGGKAGANGAGSRANSSAAGPPKPKVHRPAVFEKRADQLEF
ncbi:Elongator subunit elp4 [Tilletia horrida]|nr:Elongator subunit elp4 [Tilletia horrida]